MSDATFMLFIAGENNAMSKKALKNIKEEIGKKNMNLLVIDIFKNPHVAESAGIIATPLLMRTNPEPVRRFVGDFSDSELDFFI